MESREGQGGICTCEPNAVICVLAPCLLTCSVCACAPCSPQRADDLDCADVTDIDVVKIAAVDKVCRRWIGEKMGAAIRIQGFRRRAWRDPEYELRERDQLERREGAQGSQDGRMR